MSTNTRKSKGKLTLERICEQIYRHLQTMAAMSIGKNVIFNLAKAFPHPPPSLSFRASPKVSRVCFSSASHPSPGRNTGDHGKDSRADFAYEDKEWRKSGGDHGHEMTGRAKERVGESMDSTKERAKEMKEKAKEYAEETKEKAKEGTNRAAETAESAKESAKDYAREAKEKTKDVAGSMADKAKEGTQKAAETAEYAKEKAKDGAQSIGEKAKQTMEEAWGAAKETTQKIKETVMGSQSDERDEGKSGEKVDVDVSAKTMDEDVVEQRRKAAKHHYVDKKN